MFGSAQVQRCLWKLHVNAPSREVLILYVTSPKTCHISPNLSMTDPDFQKEPEEGTQWYPAPTIPSLSDQPAGARAGTRLDYRCGSSFADGRVMTDMTSSYLPLRQNKPKQPVAGSSRQESMFISDDEENGSGMDVDVGEEAEDSVNQEEGQESRE